MSKPMAIGMKITFLPLTALEIVAAADLIEAGVFGARRRQAERGARQRRRIGQREQRLQSHFLPPCVFPSACLRS